MTTPIVALDVGSAREALELVRSLEGTCDFYKVGLELFSAAGPQVVTAIRSSGARVFLDLKFHDIPNTVRGAVRSVATLGVELTTVHAAGGRAMLTAAAEGGDGACKILAVTILTSLTGAELSENWGRKGTLDVSAEVGRLAGLAHEAGVHGVVCSGEELPRVRSEYAGRLATLVPGIRFSDGASHDQARVITPGGAARSGADYIVLGRAVTGASDPAAAMVRARRELEAAD